MKILLSLENVEARGKINYPDFDIVSGQVSLIQGESGSGKSTLFQIMNGMLNPTEGSVKYLGKELASYTPLSIRREVLLVPQTVFLFPKTIEENFQVFYEYREEKCITPEEMKKYLALCQIPKDLDTSCNELSGGEKQRVFLAICLSFSPQILMLDEPTAALDEANATKLMEKICAHAKEKNIGLVLVSHDSHLHSFAQSKIHLKSLQA